jgi:uncharacterized membrane protein YfcA
MLSELIDKNLLIPFLFLILIVAFLYSSVGHGGGSGYLAILALFSVAPGIMKSSALLLNIFVSFTSFFYYYKEGHFRLKLFLPFALTSIPASFIGATFQITDDVYKKILGICLIFPILRMLGVFKEPNGEHNLNIALALIFGAFIGLLSGMIGIGGGIILSPIILLMHWGKMKETAAVSALFIFVNSIAGLIGMLMKGTVVHTDTWYLLSVAIIGGLTGSYFGSKKMNSMVLKYILALVLSIASIKLILT